jgi:hypothetical protein
VYRVKPGAFSITVISNLMTLGKFANRDKISSLNPAFNQPGDLLFVSRSEKRELGIFSHLGFIEYSDSRADDIASAEGVPSNDDTVRLALAYLSQLKIDVTDLAKEPGTPQLLTYHEQRTAVVSKPDQASVTNVHLRGASFVRALDGIPFFGRGTRGGCTVEFGKDSRICGINLLWRNLERYQLYPVANIETIIKWIQEGKTVWQPQLEMDSVPWTTVKRMTVVRAIPYYYGEPQSMPETWSYPFMALEAVIESSTTNTTVHLLCPMIDETKPVAPKARER